MYKIFIFTRGVIGSIRLVFFVFSQPKLKISICEILNRNRPKQLGINWFRFYCSFGWLEKEARKLRKVKCTHLSCWNMQCETKKFKQNIAEERSPYRLDGTLMIFRDRQRKRRDRNKREESYHERRRGRHEEQSWRLAANVD